MPLGQSESRTVFRPDGSATSKNTGCPVVELVLRSGRKERTFDVYVASLWVAERVQGNPDAAVRVLMDIERARRQVFALAEEGTRWQ